ncbi:hypothetical protein FY136_10325 [Agrobacterium tumefaciens]|uniref:hypothetical protein n=1 Tax=Agrobacterium tumefaciens TaxID=358 RepID=UPI0021D0FBB0|nr:hypothetical protein [Agrobacterium tumefaciens]UXT49613.1 hypothetical protein FY136_10325 [Agrobacterium tumefaciens]
MGIAVKKQPIHDQNNYEARFATIKSAASAFEQHETKTENLLHVALGKIFEFGESIRQEPQALESFLSAHGKACNKVTKANPYNALVDLVFSDGRSKSWRSQISNVLALAAETIGEQHLADWLVRNGGVSGCYDLAVRHFARPATAKAEKLRSIRLNTISEELKRKPIVRTALPGVSLPDGFHRSMLFSQGGQTFLVDIREGDSDATIEKYLLEAIGDRAVATHPLTDKPLFSLYRAVDLISGTCKPSSAGQLQCIAIWNEDAEYGAVTKLRFLSDAYSFTHATVTLANALPGLNGKGQFILDLADADIFRQQFQQDTDWTIREDNGGLILADNAKSPTRLTLLPVSDYADGKLRQGRKLGLRTRHFTMSLDAMQRDKKNLDIAMTLFQKANAQRTTPISRPKRFQWVFNGEHIELGFEQTSGMMNTDYPSIVFKAEATTLPQNELLLADGQSVWNAFIPYGEDIGGCIAHSEVEDAAFCIDHTFVNGDAVEYRSPLIIGRKMDPTQICEPFVPATLPVPPAPQTPPQGSKSSTLSRNASGPSHPGTPKAGSAPASTAASATAVPNHRTRNYALIEKNRREKTTFPTTPPSSGRAFGAFITSYLPDDTDHRKNRKFDFEWQLEWWRRMTDIPVHVIASNWTDEDVAASNELGMLPEHGGSIIRQPAQSIAQNRNLCLSELYASDFDWGIVMDDDAVLMQAENHNSSYRLFAEMAANGKTAYEGVDLFQPIFGRQIPFNKKYRAENNPYADNHVFERSTNLKGTMIIVRNFAKEAREPLFLPQEFGFVGEDTYLTLEAISKGYAPMTCWNLILEELGGESHFAMTDAERTEKMREGHQKLVEVFGPDGLRMSSNGSHKLDKNDFTGKFWGTKKKTVTIPKVLSPNAASA